MALTRTDYPAAASSPTSVATSSFTPPANAVLVAVGVYVQSANSTPWTPDACTITQTGGLTWTEQVDVAGTGASDYRVGGQIFTAVTGGSPGSMVVEITRTSGDAGYNRLYLRVMAFEGANTSSPVGGTAENSAIATNGAQSLSLSATPASTSAIVGAIAGVVANSGQVYADPASGYNVNDRYNDAGIIGVLVQVRDPGSTSTECGSADTLNASSTDTYYGGGIAFAVEIKEAGGGGGASTVPPTILTPNQFRFSAGFGR